MVMLDNAATTQPKFFASDYAHTWFNSNTPYAYAEQKHLAEAREKIKEYLGVKSGYVLFTRCATEAIEWLCHRFCTDESWCSPYEHDSVYNACDGNILTEDKYRFFNMQDYGLYWHQLVNQITGQIFDIKDIRERIIISENQFFAVDATAAIGHTALPKNMDDYCDAIVFSGHKFHSEKGIGCLWISDNLFDFLGGEKNPKNQYGLIHGTLNVPGIMAMADAMKFAIDGIDSNGFNYFAHAEAIFHILDEAGVKYDANVHGKERRKFVNAIHTIIFSEMNADALQTFLASRGIYVGIAGSACSEEHDYRVPMAFGFSKEECEHAIRISFCEDTTADDIRAFCNGIIEFKERFVK